MQTIGTKIWRSAWQAFALSVFAALGQANALTFPLAPDQNAVGELKTYTTRAEDTLLDVARHYDMGYTELITANPTIDPWLPGENKEVVIPSYFLLPDAPRKGVIINVGMHRIFFFAPDGKSVMTFPIGIGDEGWDTPLGTTKVVRKKANPAWYPPASIRAREPDLPTVVPAGPDNPMGLFALYLGFPRYAIHGTNKPYGVGRRVSHGCIRLYPEDIEQLFNAVKIGTPVRVIDQPIHAGWIGEDLYLVAFPSKTQTDEIDIGHALVPEKAEGLWETVFLAAVDQVDRIDWKVVDKVARERTGIPTRVTRPLPTSASATD